MTRFTTSIYFLEGNFRLARDGFAIRHRSGSVL